MHPHERRGADACSDARSDQPRHPRGMSPAFASPMFRCLSSSSQTSLPADPLHCSPAPPHTRPASRRAFPKCQHATPDDPSDAPPPIPPNWREVRAALVAGSAEKHEQSKQSAYRVGHWAHALSLPETGCFLASHPAYYRRKAPYLTQAVVLVTSYSPSTGTTGLVLNRPLSGTAAELEAVGVFGHSLNLSTTRFADQPVYIGGPDTPTSGILAVVHGDPTLGGYQPLDGVFVDDFDRFVVANGQRDCANFRLFSGCVRWDPGELDNEVDDGSWFCIAASEKFALEHCIQLAKPLWVEIMQSQGGPFEKIATRVYERSKEDDDRVGT